MAISMNANAEQIGRVFASEVAGRPSVAEIWVSSGDNIDLWLLAGDIDADEERSLYRRLGALDARFRDVDFQLHILKPSSYTIPLRDVLPENAKKIFSRAA
jgi:hypothetical protein